MVLAARRAALRTANSLHRLRIPRTNRLVVGESWLPGAHFEIDGTGNTITVGDRSILRNLRITVRGDNNRITIGDQVRVTRGLELWAEGDGCEIHIGPKTTIERAHLAATESGSMLTLGADCMVSTDVEIRTSDSHAIWDAEGNRINPPGSVRIGDHVWIGARALVLKGCELPTGTVVAAGSIVTRLVEQPNCVVAGSPARVIRKDVRWTRGRQLMV